MDLLQKRPESPPDPLEQNGLCLLSLDGGGVRGLSTLYILKILMDRLNKERQLVGLPKVKPCEVFDLIGGTSTGGLIAIMLGRLEMDVEQCIGRYTELMKSVFGEKSNRLPLNWKGKFKARFNSKTLEHAVRKVVSGSGASETELLNKNSECGCKVFVCAAAKETKETMRLRSYSLPEELEIPATVCEAALATSAATTFFDPVCIGARQFVDGGLGANNPVAEVEEEASNLWCDATGDLKPLVKCFISIGTGHAGKKAIEDNIFKFLSRTLIDIATDTEKTAANFAARWRLQLDEHRYVRFNVSQGLEDVGLAEYKDQGDIEAATHRYLKQQEQKHRMRDCVLNLRQEERKSETNIMEPITEHNVNLSLGSRTSTPKAQWMVPFQKNQHFVGRTDQLDKLEKEAFVEPLFTKVALIGLGGVGKTQIALELAHRTRKKRTKCSVFWVPATSKSAFEEAYLEIGCRLQIPGVAHKGADVKWLVKNRLSQETAGDWLMILDNADDSDLWLRSNDNAQQSIPLADHLPASSHGAMICTTRNRHIAVNMTHNNAIDVPKIDSGGGSELLKKSLICQELADDQGIVQRLLEQLTFLPLAIVQATAYINRNGLSISEYSSLLEDSDKNVIALLSEEFEDDSRDKGSNNAVATTWLISFDQVRRLNPLAAEHLSFMSFLHPNKIPKSLLPPAPSKKEMVDAIGILNAYSFISKRPIDQATSEESFDLHRLVRLATRNWLTKEGSWASCSGRVISRVAEVFPTGDDNDRAIWTAYLPHARSILEVDLLDKDIREKYKLLEKLGECIFADGKYDEAKAVRSQVFEWKKQTLGEEHPSTLSSALPLVEALVQSGNYSEAETLGRRTFHSMKEVGGQEDPQTLQAMMLLGMTYDRQERLEEAVALLTEALKLFEKVLGPQDPNTLTCMQSITRVLSCQEKYDEAAELQVQLSKMISKRYGPEHRGTLLTKSYLVSIHIGQERYEEAEKLGKELLTLYTKLLGGEHPETLTAMSNLALTRYKQGRLEEAEEQQECVLEIHSRVRGQEHPETLTAMSSLALTRYKQGRLEETEELQECVLKIRSRVSSQEYPETLTAMSSLALTRYKQGRLEEAEELEKCVLEIRTRVSGQEHPETLTAMSNLALTRYKQGRLEETEELQECVLKIRSRVSSQEYPETLTAMSSLALTRCEQGRLEEAEELEKCVLEIRSRVSGQEHPETLTIMSNLALTRQMQGRLEEAEELQECVLEIRSRVSGQEHSATLTAMNNLASTCYQQRRLEEAEELEKCLLEIRSRVQGQEHPETLMTMHNLAYTYEAQGRHDEALELMAKVVKSRQDKLGADHPDTKSSIDALNKWRKKRDVS